MFILFALAIGYYLPITDEPKDDGVKNEAEHMFRKMEEKLEKAKTLECVFDGYIPSDLGSFEGTLFLAEGNKVWLQIKKTKNDGLQLQVDNESVRQVLHFVSDGGHQYLKGRGFTFGRTGQSDTAKNLNAEIFTWISRTGMILPHAPSLEQKVDSEKDRFHVSNFKLGDKEKIGQRERQRIEYQLSAKGVDTPLSVVVWLDLKTLLPVKRSAQVSGADKSEALTENYTKLTLDEKVDAKKFELPK
jgi:outer membrane lipoprotein-sorting protein